MWCPLVRGSLKLPHVIVYDKMSETFCCLMTPYQNASTYLHLGGFIRLPLTGSGDDDHNAKGYKKGQPAH